MPVNFIPNDPEAITDIPMRKIRPSADRRGRQARLAIANPAAQGLHAIGTPEFLYWQCREAALLTIKAWEQIHGPFASWQNGPTLAVFPDDGDDLNAYYDRTRGGLPERISFYHRTIGNRTYFSGASTDVVAHEGGHAFLDAIRPDFWTSSRFEVNSFHEAFGDCIAIVTALHDAASRRAILAKVDAANPVETTAEELSKAIAKAFPGHNAGAARRSRNNFAWGPPGSIPETGGPGELIYEEHSFGQVFSGCFYDTIVNIFKGMPAQSEANLLAATRTAGKLLVKAAQQAPQRAQYFREVGRFMVLVDEADNSAANHAAIRDAFQRHEISLGSSLTLAPQAAFAAAPRVAGRAARQARAAVAPSAITPNARRQLLDLIGAESRALSISPATIAGRRVQQAVHQRVVPLDDVDKKLKGVVAMAPQVALVGRSHHALTVMGNVSSATDTVKDVEAHASSLLKHGRISFEPQRAARSSRRAALVATATPRSPEGITHEIETIRGQKTLVRVRFACGCGCSA